MSRIDEALRRATLPRERETSIRRPAGSGGDGAVLDRYGSELPEPAVRPALTPDSRPAPSWRIRPLVPARRGGGQFSPIDRAYHGKLWVNDMPSSVPLAEYCRAAGALHDLQEQRGLKTVMVASARPGEGTTLTIVNLALALSESMNRRVVLVDANFHRPALHTVFRIPPTRGLCEALRAEGGDIQLPRVSDSGNLSVLPAGHADSTTLGTFLSDRMEGLLSELAVDVDWVLLDAGAVELMRDPRLLARLVGAAVIVIRAAHTPYPAVQRAIARLGADHVVGSVLNRVTARDVR